MKKKIFLISVVCGLTLLAGCLTPVMAMSIFRPQTKNIDTSKAVAEINSDTSVNATKQAMEQPPVSVNASGQGNHVDVSVLPNNDAVTVKNSTAQTGGNHQLNNSDDSVAFTLGQRMLIFAIALIVLIVIVVVIWRWFEKADPAMATALKGFASVADQAGATAINNLRLKLAASQNPEAKIAYQEAIAEIEAARGKTAAAAPAPATAS